MTISSKREAFIRLVNAVDDAIQKEPLRNAEDILDMILDEATIVYGG